MMRWGAALMSGLALVFGAAVFTAASPGPSLDLTVEAAVFMALENNRDLEIQRFSPKIAATFEEIEMGRFDPELYGEFAWERQMDDSTDQDRTIEVEAGVRKRFAPGTRMTADLAYDKDSSEDRNSRHNTRVELSVTQALLRGRGRIVNLAGVRQRRLDTLASVYELKGFIQALVAETETAYWQYVLALKEIQIFQRSLDVAAQQRDEVEQQIEVGLLPENEAAAARAEEAIRNQALINANSLVTQRRLTLLWLVNPDRLDLGVTALSRPAIHEKIPEDLADRMALALDARPDLQEAQLKRDRGVLEVVVTRNGMLPKLDFFITLGINGFGPSPGESISNMTPEDHDIGAGISLSQYLGNREATARHRAAQLSQARARAAIDTLKHAIRFQVSLAVNEVARTRQQIFASRKTREYEEQTLISEQERFKVGAGTSLLVAQAQRDLLSSQIAEVRAVINYRIALIKLFLAEGSLLERRGITLPDDSGPFRGMDAR